MIATGEKWITWERTSHSNYRDTVAVTRLESEGKPRMFPGEGRPATDEEIAAEIGRRKEREENLRVDREFRNHPAYAYAKEICSRLEHMTPTDNPLEVMTVKEWANLATKLEK